MKRDLWWGAALGKATWVRHHWKCSSLEEREEFLGNRRDEERQRTNGASFKTLMCTGPALGVGLMNGLWKRLPPQELRSLKEWLLHVNKDHIDLQRELFSPA